MLLRERQIDSYLPRQATRAKAELDSFDAAADRTIANHTEIIEISSYGDSTKIAREMILRTGDRLYRLGGGLVRNPHQVKNAVGICDTFQP